MQLGAGYFFKAVQDRGCTSYINMDDKRYGKEGGTYTLEDCAVAVKKLEQGREGCYAKFFFFEPAGYCNCPRDKCKLTSTNANAGWPGQLYEFVAGT